jgi:hypothetical protein
MVVWQEMELVIPPFCLLARHWYYCFRIDNQWPLSEYMYAHGIYMSHITIQRPLSQTLLVSTIHVSTILWSFSMVIPIILHIIILYSKPLSVTGYKFIHHIVFKIDFTKLHPLLGIFICALVFYVLFIWRARTWQFKYLFCEYYGSVLYCHLTVLTWFSAHILLILIDSFISL